MSKTNKKIIILDGYNIIHRIPEFERLLDTSLEAARERLYRFCANWMSTRKDVYLFYIVFDGQTGLTEGSHQPSPGIRTVFTNTGEKADTRIVDITEERINDAKVAVVSDDNFVRNKCHLLDAEIISVDSFISLPGAAARLRQQKDPPANDKKLHPRQQKMINDDLKREWGIE
ncbi:hypothetical protein BVX97_03855 [bacterium E08(2017)]|nr:hypothetical protein BVX97_03855 [bacterium E08(2017)]